MATKLICRKVSKENLNLKHKMVSLDSGNHVFPQPSFRFLGAWPPELREFVNPAFLGPTPGPQPREPGLIPGRYPHRRSASGWSCLGITLGVCANCLNQFKHHPSPFHFLLFAPSSGWKRETLRHGRLSQLRINQLTTPNQQATLPETPLACHTNPPPTPNAPHAPQASPQPGATPSASQTQKPSPSGSVRSSLGGARSRATWKST